MRVKITVSKVKRVPNSFSQSFATPVDMFVEGDNLEFRAGGTLLEVFDRTNKTLYNTDFAFSGVDAVLAAAPTTGGHFVLT